MGVCTSELPTGAKTSRVSGRCSVFRCVVLEPQDLGEGTIEDRTAPTAERIEPFELRAAAGRIAGEVFDHGVGESDLRLEPELVGLVRAQLAQAVVAGARVGVQKTTRSAPATGSGGRRALDRSRLFEGAHDLSAEALDA